MSEKSPLASPTPSTTSFSTACTSLSPSESKEPEYQDVAETTHRAQKKLVRNPRLQRKEITNRTLLLSSPLATLIYTASSTAAALPLTTETAMQIPPRNMCLMREKGNVLRKKKANIGRPEMLVRLGGPEIKAIVRRATGDTD
jgi:hypothetical protein